jgi:Icc protein
MSTRIVQITDTHLFRDPQGVLAGIPTWKTFTAVLRQIEQYHGDFDYLILTGDLAQDEELETYRILRETLGDWIERCRILPGNHDDRGHLRKVFPELFKDNDDPLTFTLSSEGWEIIGLDSHIPGETQGRIEIGQMQWLRDQLQMSPNSPTLLFLHHPPVAISVDWLDRIGLDDAQDLIELIKASPQIKAVCAGHVHQEFEGRIGSAAIYTTPSTCVQFGARTEKSFDTKAAGYRLLQLDDDCHTQVHRLSDDYKDKGVGDK